MIGREEAPIWQPVRLDEEYNPVIVLDGEFARTTFNAEAEEENLETIRENADRRLDTFNIFHSQPFRFHDDSYLATSFHIGNNGGWLSSSNWKDQLEDEDHLTYNPHNVDTSHDAYALMSLVDTWSKDVATILEYWEE